MHQILKIKPPTSSSLRKQLLQNLSDHLNDLELFELVKTYQVHAHSRICWKYNKSECRFSYGRYLLGTQLLQSHLILNMEKYITKSSQKLH